MKKFFKTVAVIAALLLILAYGGVFLGHKAIFPIQKSAVATVASARDEKFLLGPGAHLNPPGTVEDFVGVLAAQLTRYNAVCETLWPGIKLKNMSVIAEDINKNKFYSISPDGKIADISKKDALSRGFSRSAYTGGFSFYSGGAYLALDAEELNNRFKWQEYLHLGGYDPILFLTHEGFHAIEQTEGKWALPESVTNASRNEFRENVKARAARDLLQRRLLKAAARPDETPLTDEALAAYVYWKNAYPDEYESAKYFERIEGTANYFEIITGLYCGYPEQIKNDADMRGAVALLATRDDIYVRHGLVNECYTVGGFACFLLDRIKPDWKNAAINDANFTPMDCLLLHAAPAQSVSPESVEAELTDGYISRVQAEMSQKPINRGLPLLFKMLYDILF